MNQKAIVFSLCFLLQAMVLSAQQDPGQLSYVQSYKDIAIREMVRVNIPASITLAQGILESNAGQSDLARMANNHFGIKCGSNWTGLTFQKKDDDYGPEGTLTFSCFRAYDAVEASFQDHSSFLADPQKAYRYGALFALDKTDYQGWAYGLKQAGYATSETYPNQLIGIIERYDLHEYDLAFPSRDTTALAFYPPLVTTTNDVPNTFASGFETAGDIAYRTRMPVERLLEYNENLVDGYVLPQGQKIFLAPKRNAFKGPVDFHEVAPGESVYDISQRYGVRVNKLLNRNRVEPDQEPMPGQSLKLSGKRVPASPAYYPRADTGFDQNGLPGTPLLDTGISSPEPEPAALPILFHTVEKGDTLWNIAKRYNTSVEQLMRLNNLDSNIIGIGMLLRVH